VRGCVRVGERECVRAKIKLVSVDADMRLTITDKKELQDTLKLQIN